MSSSSSLLLTCCLFILITVTISQVRGVPIAASGTPAQQILLVHEKHHRHHLNARCSRCRPGWGVAKRCSPETDTVCELCPEGTYSPHYSSVATCWLCSRCGDGLYEAHPCTRRADTLCDRCGTVRGPHNGDFSAHCNASIGTVISSSSSVGQDEAPVAVSHRIVLPGLAAEEPNTEDHQLHPPLPPPPPPRNDDANLPVITGEINSIRTTSPRPSYKVDTADNQSHRVALGAAAIAILQTALLVLAVGGVCLLARLLRNATCLRDDSDSTDKERTVQEETLLQDLKPREDQDNEP